jgi:hypothetical protein
MGYVWLLQYTSIISLHHINWLVFLMVALFSVRYGLNLYVVCRIGSVLPAVPWLRRLVADLIPAGFDPRSVHVRYVVDRMALGQVFLPVLQFFPCKYLTTCAPLLLPAGRRSEAWEPSKKQFSFGNPGTLDRKVLSVFAFLTCRVPNGESLAFDCRSPGCWKMALGQVLFWWLGVFACQYHSTNVAYSSASTCWSHEKDKWTRLGNYPKSNAVSGIGAYEINNYSLFLISLKCLSICLFGRWTCAACKSPTDRSSKWNTNGRKRAAEGWPRDIHLWSQKSSRSVWQGERRYQCNG